MKTLQFLLRKEFRQIFRNPTLLKMILAIPIIQLLVLPLTADYEIKNINIAIVDHDHSEYARLLRSKIIASGYFVLVGYDADYETAFKRLEADEADLILEIPKGFEGALVREGKDELFLAVNAINGVKANVGGSYLGQIISRFNQEIRLDWHVPDRYNAMPLLEISSINWFNPSLNYRYFMVPAILVILVTMVGAYMCALNIVKEKEVGTIEQINVSPIQKHIFILGKLIPFLVIGLFVFSVGLFGIAWLVYGIRPQGSLLLLYSYLLLYLIAVLGVGLLISTYSNTQQQAMSLAFFVMMLFLLMSGLFTPVDSMPAWARGIAYANPVTYFIEVTRMIILKGSGFHEIRIHFLIMIGFAILFNGWASLNYKKTS